MAEQERSKLISLTTITALAGLLIAIISARSAFPEPLFYGIVIIFTGVIVILVGYMFLWERSARYFRGKLWRRRQTLLSRKYFQSFKDLVEKFMSLSEFKGGTQGILQVLSSLITDKGGTQGLMINRILSEFDPVLRNPLNDFKQRMDNLSWYSKSEINERLLSSLAKEFESYILIHKRLYVDFAVNTVREIGLEHVSQGTKRIYSEYRDDYNQFVVAYTEFANKTRKELGIFSQNLQKAYEL